jgi:hypothetical protein
MLSPSKEYIYLALQGMLSVHDTPYQRSKIDKLDNERYTRMHWTIVKAFLGQHQEAN